MKKQTSLQKQAEDILLSQMHRGKSHTAQVIDCVLGILLLLILFYASIYRLTHQRLISTILSILLTALVVSVVRMVRANRSARYLQRRLSALADDVRMEKLFFADAETFLDILLPFLAEAEVTLESDRKTALWKGKAVPFHVVYVIPDEKVERQILLPYKNTGSILFITGKCTERFMQFAKKLGIALILDLSHHALQKSIPLEDADIYRYVVEHAPKRQKINMKKSLLFSPAHIVRYITCGIFLLISSMFMVYPLYYRISACVMFAFAAGCAAGRHKTGSVH